MRQNYLDRLTEAHLKNRAGADVALAIALTAFEMEIEPKLISSIQERMRRIRPADGKPRARAPLAEMQLASMLAHDPNYEAFARTITESMFEHTHRQGRGFLMPWMSRYHWKRGWSESSQWKTSESLKHWAKSIIATAHERHDGKAASMWAVNGNDQVSHVCGFGYNYLWFKYPLNR